MLFGCEKKEFSSSDVEFKSPSDACENSFLYSLNHCIAETEDGYFITNSGILHYLDKETDKIIVLSHDAITGDQLIGDRFSEKRKYEGHEAYFGEVSIFYHNSYLYTLESVDIIKGKWHVLKLDPTTMQREVLAEINSSTGNFVIVNDKIYTIFQEVENSDKVNLDLTPNPTDENKYIYTYFLSIFDLKTEKLEDSVEIPVSEDFKKYQIAYPKYDVADDIFYFDLSYSAGNSLEDLKERRILGAYNTLTGTFSFETMYDFPQDKEKSIRNIARLNDIQYYSYLALPDLSVPEPDIFEAKNAWYIEINQENVNLEKDNLNKIALPQNYYLQTNGKDIYALPTSIWDFSNNRMKSFEIFKLLDGELVSVCRIDENEAKKIRSMPDICITSNGDILLMGARALYQVTDNKITEKFDYEKIVDKYLK